MSVWLQYYSNRLELYVDLGIMRLDERGMWIDEPLDKNLAQLEDIYPLPPELPIDWLRDVGLDPDVAPVGVPTEGVPSLGERAPENSAEAVQPGMELPSPDGNPTRGPEPAPDNAESPLFGPPGIVDSESLGKENRAFRDMFFGRRKSTSAGKQSGKSVQVSSRR